METHRDDEGHDVLLHSWRIIGNHKYAILAMFSMGAAIAAVVGYRMTPIYRATALILVEDDTRNMVGMQGLYSDDIARFTYVARTTYCNTQAELIKSRAVLSAVVRRLRLDRRKESEGADDIIAALQANVLVTPLERTMLIRVSFEGPHRTEVDDVANAVVECFREESIQRRRNTSEFATGWIDEQIPRLRAEVIAAEEKLREFQEKHKILSFDRDQDIISKRLVQLSQDVTAAEKTRIELEAELAQVGREEGGRPRDPSAADLLPSGADVPAMREFDSQILSLQNERVDLLTAVRPGNRGVRALDAKIADLSARRRRLAARCLQAVRLKERMLRQALAEQEEKALALDEKLMELSDLQRKVARAKQLYEPLLARWGKLDLASGLDTVPVQIIDRAVEPLKPVKPRKRLILVVGGILGLVAGIQLAFLLERSYSKVRSPEDIERLAGLRTVGVIPHMSAKEDKKLFLACHFDPKSAAAEAYRTVRTGLLATAQGNGSAVLLVTSAIDEEGKTTTAVNIAAALAQAQKRVLLVDADMRRSSLHRPFGIERDHGLAAYLADGADGEKVVRESEVPFLSIVTAGASPQNPSELLGSERMLRFLQWARGRFDFIVLDSPPTVAVTDASVIAPLVDGILLVVRADRTPCRALVHGRKLLEDAKGNVIGAVFNDVPRQHGRYYGYGYGYYHRRYGEAEEKTTQGQS